MRIRDLIKQDTPIIMGVLNVTPDSFSDGGQHNTVEAAVKRAHQMVAEGASIIDVGGESTRPGAELVPVEEELQRVIPVIEGVQGIEAIISIDTRNAKTMAAAIDAGATLVNDVTALTYDEYSVKIVAENDHVDVCLMHMQGMPENMQNNPDYDDVVENVKDYLSARAAFCLERGISKDRIIIDVGIGFGKTLDHNIALFRNIGQFRELGYPVLMGASRKSFIEKICPDTPASQRLPGSLAAALWSIRQGADILRVHDVAETVQAIKVWKSITG